jgi:adenine-specific DNA-methyltransferase
MRSALVDYFRDEGQIMIATEAAAEGINLQFCSLVVNYDLPWNPQRIEQRIGRCHRYGQKHDVVVLNFLNRTNAADQRVYELLSQKFKLFDSVFGASDEVLGSIESGIEFEKKINEIYQSTRTTAEINEAFRQLQLDLEPEITAAMSQTRQKLLENFDDEVREKLRVQAERSAAALSRHEELLMLITRHELADVATFQEDSRFELHSNPFDGDIPTGLYELPRRSDDAHIYRSGHPLAEAVLDQARNRELALSQIQFNLTTHQGRISALEPYVGKQGVLSVELLTIEALDQTEEHLLIAVVTDEGEVIDPELARRMMLLPAQTAGPIQPIESEEVDKELHAQRVEIVDEVSTRNLAFFNSESQKLDSWAEDLKQGLEREIKELDRQIREAKKVSQAARTLEEKLAGQKEVRTLESLRNQKRKTLFDAQDTIDAQRDELIGAIEEKLSNKQLTSTLLSVHWELR